MRSLISVVSAAGAVAAIATAAPASASTLVLHSGDVFTTSHSGVICAVETGGGVSCMNTTASLAGMTNAKARATCGFAAVQGVAVTSTRWNWLCGTGVPVIATKASTAWAASHHLAITPKSKVPVIPNSWSFTTGSVNCHVAKNGSLGCAAAKNSANGFVADGWKVYPRGV